MKKLSLEDVKKRLEEHGYKLIGPYKNTSDKALLLCPAGHEYLTKVGNFFHRKSRCYQCDKIRQAKAQKIPFSTVLAKAKEHNVTVLMSQSDYEKNHGKLLKIQCQCACGTLRQLNWNALKNYSNCVKCKSGSEKIRHSLSVIRAICKKGGYSLITTEYTNNKQLLELTCDKHGIFKIRFNDIDQGHGCGSCGHSNSKAEREVLSFVKDNYSGIVEPNDRKTLGGLELDIWIPEFNLGIEFNGLYWHSEAIKKDHLLHIKKINKIQGAGINFLGIYADEWKNPFKKEIVKSMILSRMKKTKETIYARKTKISPVSKQDAKDFMNKNHLSGHVQFSQAIGLFDINDKLLMCLTLRTSMSGQKEIARMASVLNTNVVGGASKLTKSIQGSLLSYSDNRIGIGNVYKSIGFKEVTVTKAPSYYYTDFHKRVWRFKCRKLKDLSFGATEREQALNGAFKKHFGHSKPVYRIYDYGHKKWTRSYP